MVPLCDLWAQGSAIKIHVQTPSILRQLCRALVLPCSWVASGHCHGAEQYCHHFWAKHSPVQHQKQLQRTPLGYLNTIQVLGLAVWCPNPLPVSDNQVFCLRGHCIASCPLSKAGRAAAGRGKGLKHRYEPSHDFQTHCQWSVAPLLCSSTSLLQGALRHSCAGAVWNLLMKGLPD